VGLQATPGLVPPCLALPVIIRPPAFDHIITNSVACCNTLLLPACPVLLIHTFSCPINLCRFTALQSLHWRSTAVAYAVLHNKTVTGDTAVGDHVGLFPIAYLSRSALHGVMNATDWEIAVRVADYYVMAWPLRLGNDSACPQCFSRRQGWAGSVMTPTTAAAAPFVWADDQFMGLALIARLSVLGAPNAAAYRKAMVAMQLGYVRILQDPTDGLMFHGYDASKNHTSCCKWGRANGWIMMYVLPAAHGPRYDLPAPYLLLPCCIATWPHPDIPCYCFWVFLCPFWSRWLGAGGTWRYCRHLQARASPSRTSIVCTTFCAAMPRRCGPCRAWMGDGIRCAVVHLPAYAARRAIWHCASFYPSLNPDHRPS